MPCSLFHAATHLSFVLLLCLHSFRRMSLTSKIAVPAAEGICFHCLFHKAGLICQQEHDWRALPQRCSSCIDYPLSRLPFLWVMSTISFLSCCIVFVFYKLFWGQKSCQGCVLFGRRLSSPVTVYMHSRIKVIQRNQVKQVMSKCVHIIDCIKRWTTWDHKGAGCSGPTLKLLHLTSIFAAMVSAILFSSYLTMYKC